MKRISEIHEQRSPLGEKKTWSDFYYETHSKVGNRFSFPEKYREI